MAENESIASVPANVADPLQLRKFLTLLIERLDIILGYRGQDPYLSQSSLQSTAEALKVLPETLATLEASLDTFTTTSDELTEQVSAVDSRVEEITQRLAISSLLGASYYDLNYTGYASLAGWYEFTTVGSSILNSPTALVPATSYTVLLHTIPTIGGGLAQEMYITSATTKTHHKRAGSTFALVLSLGWF